MLSSKNSIVLTGALALSCFTFGCESKKVAKPTKLLPTPPLIKEAESRINFKKSYPDKLVELEKRDKEFQRKYYEVMYDSEEQMSSMHTKLQSIKLLSKYHQPNEDSKREIRRLKDNLFEYKEKYFSTNDPDEALKHLLKFKDSLQDMNSFLDEQIEKIKVKEKEAKEKEEARKLT